MKVKGKRKALFIVLSVIFGLYAVSLLFPFAYMLLNSFKTNGEFLDNVWALPKRLIEQNDLFRNYKTAFAESGLVNMLINSVVLTYFGTLVATLFPVAVAYILSKYRFKLNSIIFTVAIIFMVIPNVGTAVATYSLFLDLSLLDTYQGAIMLYAAPFGAYFLLLYGYFKGISWSYAEAAFMDGASDFRVMVSIMIPQAWPGISVVLLLNGINIWNDYYTPYMFMPNARTISTGIQAMSFNATSTGFYAELFAAVVVVLIPVIIVFLLTQKVLMNNTMAGGLKG